MSTSAIDCRGLWKILGSREAEALAAARDRGVGKTETRDQYGRVVGVADVSFQVRPGEIFCVMGLSGSGKSTLVRHLNRLIEPTAGEVQIGGRDVNKLNAADLRAMRAKEVGMVFQNTALLPHRTVNDNVALSLELRGIGEKERHAVAAEKLALVDWSGWGDRYPDELSGGMKQRVGLARAMAALDLGPQAARATPDTKLDDLVTIACTTDAPIVIWDGDAQVGVITKTVLLRGIQGHEIAA